MAHRGVLEGKVGGCPSVGRSVWNPGLGAVRAVRALDPRPEEGAAERRVGLRAEGLHLQLQLGLQLGLLLGLLVALLQMLHQHSNHHVDQHELRREHEGHEVDGRDDRVVAGGLLVTVPEGVLGEAGQRREARGDSRWSCRRKPGHHCHRALKEEKEKEEGVTVSWGQKNIRSAWGSVSQSMSWGEGVPECSGNWGVQGTEGHMLLFIFLRNLGSKTGAASLVAEPDLGGTLIWVGSHLHDAIPVVTCGDSEEGQEGHAKVTKGGMPAQALTRVCLITLWGRREREMRPTLI